MANQQALQSQRTRQLAALLRYYQLERDPFAEDGISGLFYAGGDRKNVVDALLHFSRFGTAPLFLSAPSGFGKTTILDEFASRVESDVDCAVVAVEMLLTSAQLYQKILQAFGVDGPVYGEGSEEFSAWLRAQSLRNRQVVLCLDDAQHLERSFLQGLIALVTDSELAFKLVFAGQPDARLMLENAVEQQGMLFNTLELGVLTQAQVGDYVQYRLAAAGYSGEFPLSNMQVQAAALRSRGSIAQLNDLARDLLIAGLDNRQANGSGSFPLSNLIVAALVAGVTLYFGYRSLESQPPAANAPIKLEKVPRAIDRQMAVDGEVAPQPNNASAAAQSEPVATAGAGTGDAPASIPASVAIARVAHDTAAANAQQNLEADATAQGSSAVVANEVAVSDEEVRQKEGGGAVIDAVTTSQLVEAQSVNSEQAAAEPALAGKSRRIYQRLQAWPDEGYALQVFGTHNEQRAKKLVAQYFGEADLLFYETRHNGKPWFVVINGPYTGRQGAQDSIATLPESLRRLRPWPRNIASIKGDISRYDELLDTTR